MFRQCTALFLLLAFLASTFSKAVIVVDFYANQEFIAKNLCENKGKPLMHCCGRCQLRKRLAHEENQDKNNPERRAENKNEVLFMENLSAELTAPLLSCSMFSYPTYIGGSPIDQPTGIFHPPA
jgi:hypothetical protein